ncbi:MAG: cytochrome C oxidase subunit IV family protein [Dehalococcoidia bacterium]
MRTLTYIAIWGVLVALTLLQLTIYSQPALAALGIRAMLGIAAGQAVLIVLFYQNVAYEPKSVSALLGMVLLAFLTLFLGILAS